MARILFDIGAFSFIDEASAIGVGWGVNFYTADTLSRIITYTTADGSTQNSNPVFVGSDGRLPPIWIDRGQSIKWGFQDADGAPVGDTFNDLDIPDLPDTFDPALNDFLAGDEPLPIANGGTASTSAPNAIAAIGGLPVAGGTMTDDISRSGKGVYLYWNAAGQVEGTIFVTASGDPDPTSLAGQIWMQYS